MAEPWEYWGFAQKAKRKDRAPEILTELISKTNLDLGTINEMLTGYIDKGEIKVPDLSSEGQKIPMDGDRRRETPGNSLRKPVYTTREGSNVFELAPEGVSDVSQIRELKGPQSPYEGFTTLYTRGPGGYKIVGREPSRQSRWIDVTPRQERVAVPRRPTSAEIKERQGLESVMSQLRLRRKPNIAGIMEPIVDRTSAQDVAIMAGIDPERYPEIMGLINKYPETPVEPAKGPSFFNRAAESLVGGARKIAGALSSPVANGASYAPVQPRKQANTLHFNTLEEAQSANVPRGTIIWIGNRRAVVE